ncbi:unnamed protein product, partial [Mesorhabditis spiculigera]
MRGSRALLLAVRRLPAVKNLHTSAAIFCEGPIDQFFNSEAPRHPLTGKLGSCKDCGGQLHPAPMLVPNSKYLVCMGCKKIYSNSASNVNQERIEVKDPMRKAAPYPSQIAEFLDRYVVAQEKAKKTLSVGVYQHYRRLEHNIENDASSVLSMSIGNHMVEKVPRGVINQNNDPPLGRETGSMATLQPWSQNGPFSQPAQAVPVRPPTFRALPEKDNNIRLEKSNILLIGPSGVGKTHATQTLARILDVPIALCDCTSMTQAGYVGDDVESVIQKLVAAAGGDVQKAQTGIVFLDEIDKIASAHESPSHAYRDVSGEGVQHALLKLVEGTLVNVKSGKKGLPGQQDTVQVDTSDILFVASGAFSNLDRIVGRRLDKKSLGFGSVTGGMHITKDDLESEAARKRDELLGKADQGDLINFGIVPELVGRFPVLVPFHSFSTEMLIRVLVEPQNSLIAQLKLQFGMEDVEINFSDEALREVAKMALERKTGARALRSILENALLDAKFVVPGSDIESIYITAECIRGEEPFQCTRRFHPQQAAAL